MQEGRGRRPAALCHVAVDLARRADLQRTQRQTNRAAPASTAAVGAREQRLTKSANERRLRTTSLRTAPPASSLATARRVAQSPRLRPSPGWLPERGGQSGQGWVSVLPRRAGAHPSVTEIRLLVLEQRGGAVRRAQLPRHGQERRLLICPRHGALGSTQPGLSARAVLVPPRPVSRPPEAQGCLFEN